MVTSICEAQDRKRARDLMLMLGLNEAIGQLSMTSSVCSEEGGGHVLRRALEVELEYKRKKGRLRMTWKKQVEKEGMKVGIAGEDAFCWS